ncbi:Sulfite reductase [ferredoxin] [Sphingobacterium daejeonense]|nr:Sulfite reductase [ferredoxin] [Sphingobacterium daejeonense]
MLGGGLGAQPILAHEVYDFLHEDDFIPYIEATLRVFDRNGERNNRNKARFKYLVQKLGLDTVLNLIEEEKIAIKNKKVIVDRESIQQPVAPKDLIQEEVPEDLLGFELWKATNTFEQKQKGYFGVYANIQTGDISTQKARKLVDGLRKHIADDIRITQDQNLLFKYARKESLPAIYNLLLSLGFAKPGYNSTADITTCPGTDTCNLGISNSTEMARVLENYIHKFHQDFIKEKELKIKISGCMNSCGQHGLAHIGFHGSSVKVNGNVVPAAQVMIGGGTLGDGKGKVAERVIKVPTKRVLQVVDFILTDFKQNKLVDQNFLAYYEQQGKDYFYKLLKPLADLTNLTADEHIDWGHEETFETAIGVGECAGVVIDLVATLLLEAEEKIDLAEIALEKNQYADAIYHAYSAFVWTAKALLLDKGINASTQSAVIQEFDVHYVNEDYFQFSSSFTDRVLQINKFEPSEEFAKTYILQARAFCLEAKARREEWRLVNQ